MLSKPSLAGLNSQLTIYRWQAKYASDSAPPLHNGFVAPEHAQLEDFVRFHAKASRGRGRVAKDGRLTSDSCLSFMEGFYAGFTRVTGTKITSEKRQPVYDV